MFGRDSVSLAVHLSFVPRLSIISLYCQHGNMVHQRTLIDSRPSALLYQSSGLNRGHQAAYW